MLRRFKVTSLIIMLMLALIDRSAWPAVYAAPDAPFFEDIGANLTAVHDSAAAWGDYDADGDLDLIVTGHTGTAFVSIIYRNNSDNTFTNINANLVGVRNGVVAWGDANNDGLLDYETVSQRRCGYIHRSHHGDPARDQSWLDRVGGLRQQRLPRCVAGGRECLRLYHQDLSQ